MTQHDETVYLARMLEMAREALTMSSGRSFDDLHENRMFQFAVAHAIELIGEAAHNVSSATKAELSDIPWNQIVGMRNRIVHNYWEIKLDRVWDVIVNDLKPLIAALERVVPAEPPE
jgi:uncharacterized protein with HEPN domain